MIKLIKTNYYVMLVIVAGLMSLSWAFYNLPLERLNFEFIILFALTIGIGSQITLKFPKFKSHIAVSDTFIFFAFLMYGGEIAIVLAALEALFSSWRFCKKKITVLLNVATMSLATGVSFMVVKLAGLNNVSYLQGHRENLEEFLKILAVIALTQFLANTVLASVYGALKSRQPFWETWKTNYAWTFITYFVGAIGAGALMQATHYIGFGVVIVTFPIIFFIYLSYKMYVKNMEMSITQAEQAEEHAAILEQQSLALRESEERFRSAFNYAPIGIALVASTGKWLKVNRALCNILGYSEEEFLESEFQSMLFPEDLGNTLIKIHELLAGKILTCQLEQRYLHKSGRTVWAAWSVSAAGEFTNETRNLIFQIQDITDRKIAERKLQYEATHDALTNLPNRAYFMSRLEKALAKSFDKRNYRVSILFIDLDRFKIINDSLGHLVGDELLINIAERLRDCLRPNDMVARLGGDEFTILVEGHYAPKEVIGIAERIQKKFAEPFNLSGVEVYSSASIGILHNSEKHLTAEDMMRDADTAMYHAKRAGKARHEVFDENMHEMAKALLELENDLRRAVEKEEFSVYYQPIYSIHDRRIQGFEALARWEHAKHGFVSPEKFIPLAEEIGLISTLGMQILRKACRQGLRLKNCLPANAPFMISVNISNRQFSQPNLVENIRQILDETQFQPEELKLELTESIFIEQKDKALEIIQQLLDIGVEINIDDFGTGYSNLSYLMQLPISTLKIDRTFIDPMDINGRNVEIVHTILQLAQSFGINVIAEGVENESQVEKLKDLNCQGAQGYLFARPMSFEQTLEYLGPDSQDPPGGGNLPQNLEQLPVSTIQ